MTFTSPACGASNNGQTFTISWTTNNATEVWLESGPVASALQNADPKTDSNGQRVNTSTNVASGSVQAQYDCSTPDYYYYLIEVYNPFSSPPSKAGQVQQVPRG